MVHSVSIYKPALLNRVSNKNSVKSASLPFSYSSSVNKIPLESIFPSSINTSLSASDKEKYTYLINYLRDVPKSQNSKDLTCNKQLDFLLKNGKLLSKSSNDSSTTLDNLYSMAKIERKWGLNSKQLISNTLDILTNPRIVTQTFGDIPSNEKSKILSLLPDNDEVKKNPALMNVTASGTCAAAANEVNLADKYPAEFARWVSKLSGKDEELYLNIKLDSLSKNKLDAVTILDLLEAQKVSFGFDKVKIRVSLDKNAYIRAQIQDKYWDPGERNVADVLVQSAIMQLGSQNTYNTLTDTRGGNFNANSQGLIEIEKTFVESLIKNKEITSLVYQNIDEDQNLVGYNCSFDMMQKHITQTLDSGDDVIIGYVLTNETSGRTASQYYSPETDGAPNKVINGHEITIVDYKTDANGKISFVCIDTDDDSNSFVEYSADWLLPKLHHAGYPAKIVEKDEKEIMKKMNV